ncbi:MAG TPA: ATP-binding cassette domain-containing protein [Chitinispirillaceae bacterium]|nr:ATP-binding cassette domain-containing protein [Chitinispirillaceae bacterium]
MITFDNVWLFQEERIILKNVNFFIKNDEKVAILGPSGAGKTTILRLILGLVEPDSGRVLINGDDYSRLSESKREKVRLKFSIVFQEGALFDSLTVKENVGFYFHQYFNLKRMKPVVIEQRVSDLLKKVGLQESAELMPEQLSGGMKRRVAIARALAVSDAVMNLYDEPTSGLDPVNVDIIRTLISELAQDGRGFIVVTHEILDALVMASRFLFLTDGEILFDGTRDAIIHTSIPQIVQFLMPYRKILNCF